MPDTQPYLYLAPLRGLTDALFRDTLSRHFGGFDAAVAPFITPQKKTLFDDIMLRDVLPDNNQGLSLVPQILHTDPESFIVLARRLADLGYRHVNWNLGCPAPMVARKKKGSGLLPYPEVILDILQQVMPQLGVELSIKTRLGFHNRSELAALLPQLDQFPLKEIIIHTRLGVQLYKGATDPDGFAECQKLSRHPLVYNGDINDLAAFTTLATRFPTVDRWMIGRGALSNPFLPEEIKGLPAGSADQRRKRLYAFHQDLVDRYQQRLSGQSHVLSRLKQLWSYLIISFPGQEKLGKKILKSNSLETYWQAIEQVFAA
ncbi:MAG: tRNA-dihydrouridine synthase family protein [Desulforhopalus sp.]|nr:tRNA-dihydrouridine synthase family protein [Desulforhopalus sp.]